MRRVSGDILYCTIRFGYRLLRSNDTTQSCDPTCGSGGMLIQSWSYVKEKGGKADNLTLHGQESNYQTVGMSKMNLVL